MRPGERFLLVGLVLLAVVATSRGSHAINAEAAYHLAVSHSLLHDRDLDLRNQHAPDGRYLFQPALAEGLASVGPDGHLYPREGLGFSIAMVPVFGVAEALAAQLPAPLLASLRWSVDRAVRDLVSFACAWLYAWLAVRTIRLTRQVVGVEPRVGFTVALAFVVPPLLFTSILALTEIPAAFLILTFVQVQTRTERPGVRAAWPLALLPWLHARYLAVTLAGLAWLTYRERASSGAWRRAVPALGLCAISVALLAAERLWLLGTLAPDLSPDARMTLSGVASAVLGSFVDRDFGLLWVAPFWMFAVAGSARLRRTHPDYVRFAWWSLAGLCLLTALIGSRGGSSPPGRLLVPVLPAFIPLLASAINRLAPSVWRWPAYAAFAWAGLMSLVFIDRPGRMWSEPGGGISRIPAATVGRLVEPAARLSRRGVTPDDASFLAQIGAGNVDVVELFLDAGFQPGGGLVQAVRSNRPDSLAVLVARLGEPGPDAGLALAYARVEGRDAMVGLLASAGTSVDSRNPEGETALMTAVRDGRTEDADVLVRSGADVNAAENTGHTALAFAAIRADAAAITRLITEGANVNSRDVDGWTPIMSAARSGRRDIVDMLLTAGAEPGAMSLHGWTALMWAAHEGHLAVVQALLAAGAGANVMSAAGQTPLIRAAGRGHMEVVRALVRSGANPLLEVNGAGARAWAERNGHVLVAAFLARTPENR